MSSWARKDCSKLYSPDRASSRAAFTIIEVIVLLAVLALLIGLLIPALGASRERARAIDCAARLRQLGIATNLYVKDFSGALPQVLWPRPDNTEPVISPLLFGGKLGNLHREGLDEVGPEARPLNRYVSSTSIPGTPTAADIEVFQSPADRGGVLPGVGPITSTFDAFGTSYTYNDHRPRATPEAPLVSTLIPLRGGPMPKVLTPDRTWLMGSLPVYNFDTGIDHQYRWYRGNRVRVNLLMVDMHGESGAPVAPPEQRNDAYTSLPSPTWPE